MEIVLDISHCKTSYFLHILRPKCIYVKVQSPLSIAKLNILFVLMGCFKYDEPVMEMLFPAPML